jgi:Putative zinc dependent peptidase (DUF5700)
MKRAILLLLLLAAAGCASAPAPSGVAPAPSTPGQTPFAAPPAAAHEIRVSIDASAAKEIMGTLARPHFEMSDAKILEGMRPIALTIKDSGRPEDVFERDLAAAWDPETRTAVFDFATIRRERERWQVVLAAVESGKREIEQDAERRAAALLPGDKVVATKLRVDITFGVAGLADHLSVTTPDGAPAIIIDLARALGESEPAPAQNLVSRLVRLIAGELYRQAWAVYREGNPAWTRPLPGLGPIEPLIRVVAEGGPISIFGVDESFFPLSTWLKEPMQRSMNDMNRMGERLVESDADLDARISLLGEIKRSDFRRRVAGPAGAFMEDGIIQAFGLDTLRKALSEGPVAFFQQYDRATKQIRDLLPLSKEIVERLAAASGAAPK